MKIIHVIAALNIAARLAGKYGGVVVQ